MICYFSGTGNSQLAARQIADTCGDTIFSINKSLQNGVAESLHSDKPFVFVVPIYAWRIPRIVKQWILKTTFTGSKRAYFILTCGAEPGNPAPYIKALCNKKQLEFHGAAGVVMPENYLVMFPTPDKVEAKKILAAAIPKISAFTDYINSRRPLPHVKPSFIDRIKSGPVNSIFYAVSTYDSGFAVDDGCIGCNLCANRCPLLNITMENNRPHWNGSCTHCMACIAGCPTEAIEYENKSKGRSRYYIMKD